MEIIGSPGLKTELLVASQRSESAVGSSTHVRQDCEAMFRQLNIIQPILVVVRDGQKHVGLPDGRKLVARAGEAIGISGGLVADVRNIPGESGVYKADMLVFSDQLIEAPTPQGLKSGVIPSTETLEECLVRCQRAAAEGADVPSPIISHRFKEMLLWLANHGIALDAAPRSLECKLHQIISRDVAAEWSSAAILGKLASEGHAMSEATLRRKLAAAGTSLSHIITDVRLSQALFLLQTTDRPVITIALDCGYASPSRFAQRFRQRFGVTPTALRNRP